MIGEKELDKADMLRRDIRKRALELGLTVNQFIKVLIISVSWELVTNSETIAGARLAQQKTVNDMDKAINLLIEELHANGIIKSSA